MLELILATTALITAGALLLQERPLTIKWLKKKVANKLAKEDVSKVALVNIQKMINECDSEASIKELQKIANKGYSCAMVEIGYDGQIIGDIELIRDKNAIPDPKVEKLLGIEGMVVIET